MKTPEEWLSGFNLGFNKEHESIRDHFIAHIKRIQDDAVESQRKFNVESIEEICSWRDVVAYYLGDMANISTPQECRKEAFKRSLAEADEAKNTDKMIETVCNDGVLEAAAEVCDAVVTELITNTPEGKICNDELIHVAEICAERIRNLKSKSV